MKHLLIILSIILVAGLFSSSKVAGEIYQWTDQNGVKHFSHTPPPPNQEKFNVSSEIQSTDTTPSASKSKPKTPTLTQEAPSKATQIQPKNKTYQNNTVELFSTSWCGYCKKARQFLIAHNIPFKEYDIDKNKAAAKRKKQLSGRSGVPYAIINGKGIYGFSEGIYARALGLK